MVKRACVCETIASVKGKREREKERKKDGETKEAKQCKLARIQ